MGARGVYDTVAALIRIPVRHPLHRGDSRPARPISALPPARRARRGEPARRATAYALHLRSGPRRSERRAERHARVDRIPARRSPTVHNSDSYVNTKLFRDPIRLRIIRYTASGAYPSCTLAPLRFQGVEKCAIGAHLLSQRAPRHAKHLPASRSERHLRGVVAPPL